MLLGPQVSLDRVTVPYQPDRVGRLEAEISEGSKHTNVVVRIEGTYIGRFGIRRNRNVGHDYIPRQIYVTMQLVGDHECRIGGEHRLRPDNVCAENLALHNSVWHHISLPEENVESL